MKNISTKLSAIVLSTLFAAMQVSYANDFAGFDTGLGKDNGGAVINNATGGLKDITIGMDKTTGLVNTADLNFNGNAHVNWNTLNVDKGQTMNFNAVDGASGLTVLNTVNQGMSNIYGTINANNGISQLIISNPNGMLYDGAHFTTAGDLMLTTKDLSNIKVEDLGKLNIDNEKFSKIYNTDGSAVGITIKDSNFNVGGEYNIVSPLIVASDSTLTAKTLKMVTTNGQDYAAVGDVTGTKKTLGVGLKAVTINGDVYITTPGAGTVQTANGGTINGNLNINSKNSIDLNRTNDGERLAVNGNLTTKSSGQMTFLRNANIKGNLDMSSDGGFVDIGNANITGNANLTTTGVEEISSKNYNHFVHVVGDTSVGGDLNIESSQNIHIGGYDYDNNKLLDGKLTVGGNLNAHSTDGHVTTTIDTSANKITMKSDKLNLLTDGKATLSANEYEFSSNGYIGGLAGTDNQTVDEITKSVMESYTYIPNSIKNGGNLNISGGTITALNTPTNANILSKGDVKITGANVGKSLNITAPEKYMEITGENVHANEINVGKETKTLKVDFPSRDYTLNYTNIRDGKKVTVNKDEVVTYELTNAPKGYNDGNQVVGETTYLVGPEKPVDPEPTPEPQPSPVTPVNPVNIDDNENAKVLRSFENQSIDLNQVYTPVAYAADLDDDQNDTGVRKNVDGSVTVVRAFPMIN